MRIPQAAAIIALCLVLNPIAFADSGDETATQADLLSIKDLKLQLFNDLDTGDIRSDAFDDKTELDIANTQIEIAKYYLAQGDRKNAAISAIIARKILQRIYNNPNDPRLIRVYSLLVQIYNSSIDTDNPNVNESNADKAKLYRQAIDHIHAL